MQGMTGIGSSDLFRDQESARLHLLVLSSANSHHQQILHRGGDHISYILSRRPLRPPPKDSRDMSFLFLQTGLFEFHQRK